MSVDIADARYRELLLEPVRVCANYRPAFGTARGEEEITLDAFRRLFGSDPLYSWLGLDSPLMYSAHKAAGGMTSIYRQIGIGCERLVRGVIQDTLRLDDEEVRWGYDSVRSDGRAQRLTLDARIDGDHLADKSAVDRNGLNVRAATSISTAKPRAQYSKSGKDIKAPMLSDRMLTFASG